MIINKIVYGFKLDAYKVTEDNKTFVNVNILDTFAFLRDLFRFMAHRDAWQLIPTVIGQSNAQFALASIENITFKFCSMASNGHLQGIFCSDGVIINLIALNNVFHTKSQHHITINGLLSGYIDANFDKVGKPARVVLNPARIGGGENVWIHSFANTYKYRKVKGSHIIDNRKKLNRPGVHLKNFDAAGFINRVKREPQGRFESTNKYAKRLAMMALDFGQFTSHQPPRKTTVPPPPVASI